MQRVKYTLYTQPHIASQTPCHTANNTYGVYTCPINTRTNVVRARVVHTCKYQKRILHSIPHRNACVMQRAQPGGGTIERRCQTNCGALRSVESCCIGKCECVHKLRLGPLRQTRNRFVNMLSTHNCTRRVADVIVAQQLQQRLRKSMKLTTHFTTQQEMHKYL